MDVSNHPLVHDVNREQLESLADWTGAPLALGLAILVQAIWIAVGLVTKLDPFPFAFLLTCSNVLQLILIFVLAVGQRQSSQHAELRAEHDHDSISRLLYHQEVQEQVLIALARKIGVEIESMEKTIEVLATQDA
jgi:uncharacterized membrane protein